MKKILSTLLLLITAFATQVLAQVPAPTVASVPQTLHIQSVLIDDGGNVLYNQQEADILFQIVNAQDQVLYQENQHVYIIKGTMSVLIGEGNDVSNGNPTGGIPPSVFDPRTGEKMVRYKLANQTVYSEDLKLATVPYSNYAGYALDVASPLNSQQIADGGIEPVDLSQNTIDFLNDTVTNTTRTEFQTHRDQRDAHTARNIAIQNAFVYIRGTNLQASVESIDATFNLFREYDRQMQDQITNLIADITEINTAIGDLNNDYVNVTGDTMTGNLNIGGNIVMNDAPGCPTDATSPACRTVDGVDVSNLQRRLNDHLREASAEPRFLAMGRMRADHGSNPDIFEVNFVVGATINANIFTPNSTTRVAGVTVTLTEPAANSNYVVMISHDGSIDSQLVTPEILNNSTFQIRWGGLSGGTDEVFQFLVVGQ